MSLTFPVLVILLLPGFFSLWTYRGFSYENLDKRGEAHVVALGLAFGMLDLGVYRLLGGRYLLNLPDDASFLSDGGFFLRYAVLSVIALAVGMAAGLLSRSRWGTPVWWSRFWGAKLLNVNPTAVCESALHHAIQEMSRNGVSLLVGISEYEGGPYKALGFYYSNSREPRELVLTDTNLFRGLAGNELKFVRSRPSTSVLCGDGSIVTLMPLTAEQKKTLRDNLQNRLSGIQALPTFYR